MPKFQQAKKPIGRTIRHAANEYVKLSTIHGFSYLSDSNPSGPSRIFWMIVAVLAILFTIFQMSSLRSQWKKNPVVTTLDTIALPIDEIEFPAVTICPQGSIKDILDNVLFKQFIEYVSNKTNPQNHIWREKRFNSKEHHRNHVIEDNEGPILNYQEMIEKITDFLNDVYPGAKEPPTKLVSLLASDDPQELVRNEAIIFPSNEEECSEKSNYDILASVNKQLKKHTCPDGFSNSQEHGCIKLIEDPLRYNEASDYCSNHGEAKLFHLRTVEDIKRFMDFDLLGKQIEINQLA